MLSIPKKGGREGREEKGRVSRDHREEEMIGRRKKWRERRGGKGREGEGREGSGRKERKWICSSK